MKPAPSPHGPLSCARAFRLIAHDCLEQIERNHGLSCRGSPDALHRMRIAFTKLAAARKFFSAMVAGDDWRAIKHELAWLNRVLGAARDSDVALASIDTMPASARRRIDRQEIAKEAAKGHASVTRALQSKRYRRLVTDIHAWVDAGSWSGSTDAAARKLRKTPLQRYAPLRLKTWSDRFAQCDMATAKNKEQHRMRIMAKRFRYMAEALAKSGLEASGKTVRRARAARQLQRSLGDLRDQRRIRRSIGASQSDAHAKRRRALLHRTSKALAQFA